MRDLLAQLVAARPLDVTQARLAFELIMTGQATHAQAAALLALIQLRGPTIDELVGAATVMREKVMPVTVPAGLTVVDTCGTGGDHSGTFNISTAAAVVTGGAGRSQGIAVAKHGNRSVTSKSGSSQVLEELGVKLRVTPKTLSRCLDEAGLCFCFAPAHHPAMKHAIEVRQQLGFRTIFNLLGPLTNPARASRQVIGVYDARWTQPLAQALLRLGSDHAMVVHGEIADPADHANSRGPIVLDPSGIDELTVTGPSQITQLKNGHITTYEVAPTELSLPVSNVATLTADGPASSAKIIREILSGQPGPARDIVCLNAAAALVVAGVSPDLAHGIDQAREAIDDGRAKRALEDLVRITQSDPTEA